MREIIDALPDHAVLCLTEGRYEAESVVRRSLTLRGQGAVVIDAHSRGTTLWVIRPDITVAVGNVTLRRGSGGGVGEGIVAGNDGPAVEVDNRAADGRMALLVERSVLGDPPVVVKAGRVQLAGSLLSSPVANIEDGGGNSPSAVTDMSNHPS